MTPPAPAVSPDEVTTRWQARFRAARVSLPQWARDAPDRCLYVGNPTGVFEIHAWDRTEGTQRQVTDRPNGTYAAALPPDGQHVWWFADTDGDEFGTWVRQPFGGGADEPATPGVGAGYPAGLALGSTATVVGTSTDDGTAIHLLCADGSPRELYRSSYDARVGGLSRDESLAVVAHSEHGDSRHMALRVLRLSGTGPADALADLWDGEGKGLEPLGFAPVLGDTRILALHERRGRPELLVWDPVAGTQEELDLGVEGEVEADWYPDGLALLARADHRGRATLHRFDLATRTLSALPTPPGVVSGATARPDAAVWYSWSSAAIPPAVRDVATADVVLAPPGHAAPGSVAVTDADVRGPGGTVHALVARPAGSAPYPTAFVVHGGPQAHDEDAFRADRAAWVDNGFAVVQVNYRGSSGYGSGWRDAIEGRPGLTELEDLAAVREWAVSTGLADPARLLLTGASWGGYLTLLGLGTQPGLWSAGVASVPVADYIAAYEDEMEPLRAYDRALFGGSPEQLPDVYRRCSPITYVDAVQAPVLVMAGANDPRCPIRQIDNYLARLVELGKPHEVYRYDAGHGSLVVEERIRQMTVELDFAARALGGVPVG